MPQFARCGEGPSVRCHGLLKGCNSMDGKPEGSFVDTETLSLFRYPIAERRGEGAAERVHAKGFVDSVANCL